MNKNNYLTIIGIEVHLELKTKSKMFCGCCAGHFRVKPNTHTCPVCLGLPGALPVPNRKAIEWCFLIGKALNCNSREDSSFDRKNYFYPDLAKGFQISQFNQPFCREGFLTIKGSTLIRINLDKDKPFPSKKVRINRVHMEEDTAKLLHKIVDGEKVSLIDFNRSGVPLVEIVTEADINSSQEAVEYLKKLQQIIRYLGVSDCDMEKGSMRCEINISLISQQFPISNFKLPNYKVEIKNINSFKFVKRAIEYEITRQKELLKRGESPIQETRGFNENRQKTYSQRSKEEAHDYRYFPEPDIPLIKISNLKSQISNVIPELPEEKKERFIKVYNLSEYNASILVLDIQKADYYEGTVKAGGDPQGTANIIINKRIDINKFTPKQLVKHLQKQKTDKVSDTAKLNEVIDNILKQNQKAAYDFKKGKQEVIGFLIGQVIRETAGKADAQTVKKLLIEKLK